KRVAEPELAFLTDEDVGGPDPLARQYDFSADPLDYANNQARLVEYYRGRILDKFVKDGDSWAKARRGYLITLNQQLQSISMMAPWIGGAHVNRDRKGDPNGRPPIEVVAVEKQRAALRFVMQSAFRDQSYGLTPEILKYMTVDKWWDGGGMRDILEEPAFPIHDRIIGVQATALTLVMNPTVLKRVYDNEFRVPATQDTLTLPELFKSVGDEIWSELDATGGKAFDNRNPMISSLRRNLQREHLARLIDLSMPDGLSGAAAKPVSNLATAQLREIRSKIDKVIDVKGNAKKNADDYTFAHLAEAALRIDKVLDSQFIYNTDKIGGGGGGMFFMFGEGQQPGGIQQRPVPSDSDSSRP
ncbi:MAG: zinc-dependent metalloprotease, partial [Phycisphaerales bacterium]|nr:zinc-dependent metalloprotease [Phycisphaerales bacterium]